MEAMAVAPAAGMVAAQALGATMTMGTMTGTVNMGNMLGVVLLQPGIGWVLDRYWDGQLVNGAHVYSVAAYHVGFMLLSGWAVLSVLLIAMTRETYCKPVAG